MKRWWHLVIAFAVLVGLVAFLEHDFRKEEKTKEADEKKSLVVPESFAWDNVHEFQISTENTEVTFIPTDKKPDGPESWSWAMSKPLATETDSADVQNFLRTLRELKTKSEIEELHAELAAFGLDPERSKPLRLKLQGKDSTIELLLGSANPDKSANYAQLVGSKKVLLVEQKLDYLRTKELDYFRNHTPLMFDNNLVTKFTYKWQGEPTLVIEKQDSINGLLTWKMLAPFVARADTLKLSSYFGEIKSARVDKFPSESADKEAAEYGLNKPRGELELELTEKKTIKLLIGADNHNKSGFYVRRADLPSVFEMQAFHLEKFKKTATDFVDHNIGKSVDIAATNKISISGKKTTAFEVRELANGLWQYVANKAIYPASRDKVQVLLRKLHDLAAKEFVARQPQAKHELQKPQYEILLTETPKEGKSELRRFAFSGVKPNPPKGSKIPKQLQPEEVFVQGGVDNFIFKIDPMVYGILQETMSQLRDQRPIYASLPYNAMRLEIGAKKNNYFYARKSANNWEVKERKGEPLVKGYGQESFEELARGLGNLEVESFASFPETHTTADPEKTVHLIFSYEAHADLEMTITVHSLMDYRIDVKPSGEFKGYTGRLKKGTVDTLFNLLGVAKQQAAAVATPTPPAAQVQP